MGSSLKSENASSRVFNISTRKISSNQPGWRRKEETNQTPLMECLRSRCGVNCNMSVNIRTDQGPDSGLKDYSTRTLMNRNSKKSLPRYCGQIWNNGIETCISNLPIGPMSNMHSIIQKWCLFHL